MCLIRVSHQGLGCLGHDIKYITVFKVVNKVCLIRYTRKIHMTFIMSGAPMLTRFGVGVVSYGWDLKAKLFKPTSRVAKQGPINTEIPFLASAPATGPKRSGSTTPTAAKPSSKIVKRTNFLENYSLKVTRIGKL